MNKRLVAILVLVLVAITIITTIVLNVNKKNNVVDDNYNSDTQGTQTTENVYDSEVTEPTEEVTTDVVEEPVVETPVEDTYELASVPIDFDPASVETAELQAVTDTEVISKIDAYIENFHYNYYFLKGINAENGNVEVDAMTLFALSYIMQNEHNELRFDSNTFTLYIPKNHVIEVVQRFFYRQLDVFKAYPDLKIDYKDEEYAVIVEDEIWNDDLTTDSVEKMGDFTYKVTCSVTSRTTNTVVKKIHAIVDETKDGLVLVNYKVEDITQ